MPVEIRADLPPELVPLAWMIGRWEGVGVGGYPGVEEFQFGQEIVFSADEGKPYLAYESRSWALDETGAVGRPMAREAGFWRPQKDGRVEVTLAHPMGITEIYVGEIQGAKIELRTDVVARTETARDYSAGHRLYGHVEGDLLYAFDMAAGDKALQPHISARLKRAEGAAA